MLPPCPEKCPRTSRLRFTGVLRRQGFSSGGLVPFGVYDPGGYLPVGLSMAFNGTGRPEPVGAAAHSTRPLVNRIELDGRVIAEQLTPHLVASINDYGYLNSRRPTGKLIPG